jgi:List-Bact-rpt repeat protein/putative pyrroloquinoline-quinone-binding quinoprotein
VGALAVLALFCTASVAAAAEPPVTAAADSLRTSWYPDEPQLTPQLLENGGFGEDFTTAVQGQVYAQPLVSGNTLFVATEENWVYGIDRKSGEINWAKNFGTPWNPADIGCTDLQPSVGITGTPVIDPNTNIAYFVAKGYASNSGGPAIWKMHAVSLANGEEQPGFPVTISGEAENLPGVNFEPTHQLQRPALLLMHGVVYAAFGSHCDFAPFHGWIFGVSTSGQIKAKWATSTENGGAIWQGGGGLVSDGEGQILFSTGNAVEGRSWSPLQGPGNAPPEGRLGNSVVRAEVQGDGSLRATDFFSPYNNEELDLADRDLGSGAPLALPSPYFGTATHPNLLVQVGKQGVVYMLDRDELGGMGQGAGGENADLSESEVHSGVWGSLATWPGDGGYVYIPAVGDAGTGNGGLEFLRYSTEGDTPKLEPVARAKGLEFGSGSPIVTSNGTAAGSAIVWVSRCPPGEEACEGSTLDAYAAVPTGAEPQPLWSREIGISTKFARPDASGGRIYVGTRAERVVAFGPHYTLAVTREGGSGGSVSSDVEGIDCGSTCSHSFQEGAAVTLTATPAQHFAFAGWSGGGCAGTGACHVRMYEDTTVTASFVRVTHRLTVARAGAGSGTVVSSPAGIECGSACNARFDEASSIRLEALPGPTAVTWRGCTNASGRVCEVNDLESDREVTASFLPVPETKIASAKILRAQRRATFRFNGTAETRAFQCKLVGPSGKRGRKPVFTSCRSPRTIKHLLPGRYTLQVRAENAAGLDPTPAQRRFRI